MDMHTCRDYQRLHIVLHLLVKFSAPMLFHVGKVKLCFLAKYLMKTQLLIPAPTLTAGGNPACLAARYEIPPNAEVSQGKDDGLSKWTREDRKIEEESIYLRNLHTRLNKNAICECPRVFWSTYPSLLPQKCQ